MEIDRFAPRKSARALLAASRRRFTDIAEGVKTKVQHLSDGAMLMLGRQRLKSGTREVFGKVRMGPNCVHAFITHPDGSVTDLGVSPNLLTNIGDMVLQGSIGGAIPAGGIGSPATATSATSITATGTPWTASNLATPQLGLAGFRVYAPVVNITTPPVYGNIVSNTTSVATIDQWWTGADGVGATPASTNAFIIGAGGIGSVRFMALTTSATAASATDTTLPSEITTGGCGRALATFTRGSNPSSSSGSFTLQKQFNVQATFTAIHKIGLFCCLTSAGADPVIFESVLNQDATVANLDTLTVTDTVTLAGP